MLKGMIMSREDSVAQRLGKRCSARSIRYAAIALD